MEGDRQYFAEQNYSSAMLLLNDALLVSNERGYEGVSVLLDAAMKSVRAIGILCEINGQKRIEGEITYERN